VSQGLAGVRKAAREHKETKFTALLHHATVDLLRDSFSSLKRKAAPGVDGMTWQEYGAGLEGRLADLHSRLHRGAYRALPSRRVYIEKGDGRKRPLGIAALEDKIVQHAAVTILNQIYEEDSRAFACGITRRSVVVRHNEISGIAHAKFAGGAPQPRSTNCEGLVSKCRRQDVQKYELGPLACAFGPYTDRLHSD
jgi:hypothetical protein